MDDKISEDTNKINRPEKKKKTKTIFISAIIVVIIIFGGIFLNLSPSPESEDYSYNNYEFFKDDMDMWNSYIKVNGQVMQIQFNYHPTEVLDLDVDPRIATKVFSMSSADHIIVAVDEDVEPVAVVATAQISRLHGIKYIKTPINGGLYDDNFNLTAFLQNESRDESIFVTNCGLTSNSFMVMRFTNGNETSMKFYEDNPNCIHVTAKESEDFRKLADRFVYELLGIIKRY